MGTNIKIGELESPFWERQRGEQPMFHKIFTDFMAMPPEMRSLPAFAKLRVSDPKDLTREINYLKRQSSRFKWTERVAAWDDLQISNRIRLQKKEHEEAAKRHIKQMKIASAVFFHPIQKLAEKINSGDIPNMDYKELYDMAVRASKPMLETAGFERRIHGETDLTIKSESITTTKNLSPTADDVKNMSNEDLIKLVEEAAKLGIKTGD